MRKNGWRFSDRKLGGDLRLDPAKYPVVGSGCRQWWGKELQLLLLVGGSTDSGVPLLDGHCSASLLLRTLPSPSPLRPTSRFSRLYGLPAPRFHDGRRRASPVAQRVLATVPPLPPRRSRVSVSASLRPSMLSSPWGEGFGLRNFHFSGLPVRSLTLRPGDSQSSFRRLCRWASGHWFPSSLPSKLQGCWLFALVGL